jgi:hypothetical protein
MLEFFAATAGAVVVAPYAGCGNNGRLWRLCGGLLVVVFGIVGIGAGVAAAVA